MSSMEILIRWRVQRLKKERKRLDEIDTRTYRLRRRLKLKLRLRLRKRKRDTGEGLITGPLGLGEGGRC